MASSEEIFDVFLCHNSEDKDEVKRIGEQLKAQGLKPWLDEWHLQPGKPWQRAIEKQIRTASSAAVFVGKSGMGPWQNLEQEMFLREFLKRNCPVIPVILTGETPELPLFLGGMGWVELQKKDPDPIKQLVWGITGIRHDQKEPSFSGTIPSEYLETLPQIGALPLGSHMPLLRNEQFVGRESALFAIGKGLAKGTATAIGQVAAATGLGGIGKTQLASEFVYRYGQFFADGVFWMSFANRETIPSEISKCGNEMNLGSGFDQLPVEAQVERVLGEWKKPGNRLLVFDNCEEERLLTEWKGRVGTSKVLLTSRRQRWSGSLGISVLRLTTLDRKESIALLNRLTEDMNDPHFNDIAQALGDLPLALFLAGSYLDACVGIETPGEYLKDLGLEHPSMKGEGLDGHQPTEHEMHVIKTFDKSYGRLDEGNREDRWALRLLEHATFFAVGEPLPVWLWVKSLGGAAQENKISVAGGVKRLVSLGLVERELEVTVGMHRLVGQFVRTRMSEEQVASGRDAVLGVMLEEARKVIESGFPGPLREWVVHLRMATDEAIERKRDQAADLSDALARYYEITGSFKEARSFYKISLSLAEQKYEPGHPNIATCQSNLATVLRNLGELKEARDLLRAALASNEKTFEPGHPSIAIRQSNLALVLKDLGELEEARDLLRAALASDEKTFEPGHPTITIRQSNLAIVLQDLGELEEARDLLRAALASNEKTFEPGHPNIGISQVNLGHVYKDLGKPEQARQLFEAALVTFSKKLDPNHRYCEITRSLLKSLE